jgi:hypothetical protein
MAEAAVLRNAGMFPGGNVDVMMEALLLEIARRAKRAGLPHIDTSDAAHWSGGPDLDTEARALLALHRCRSDDPVQAAAESIVRDEGEKPSPVVP